MAIPELIYCASGNARFAQIAIDAGFLYGAQMPGTVYHWPYFVDQDWRRPNLKKYAAAVKQHRPNMASVLDWEQCEQLPKVLAWAETIAPFVEVVMIIPKVLGGVPLIPRSIGGKPVRLGYSVPTRHGGTPLNYSEFYGWPVHLLGGSPQKQRLLTSYLDVVSIDGNMFQMMATRHSAFFDPLKQTQRGYWPTLKDFDGGKWGDGSDTADAPYEAFRRSCKNIIAMWQNKPSRYHVLPNKANCTELLTPGTAEAVSKQLSLFSTSAG